MNTGVEVREPTVQREDQDGDNMARISNAHKRGKLGFEKYANSATLSDVTIRYGHSGELAFRAHKMLLSTKSYWFEAAFTGRFMESDAREITLQDDDPTHIEGMLNFAYTDTICLPEEAENLQSALFCIGLCRVADKYDFPELEGSALYYFECDMERWLGRCSDLDAYTNDFTSQQQFCNIVSEVYKLPNAGSTHPVVSSLLRLIDDESTIRILGKTGNNQAFLLNAAKQYAEFGRDLFLHLMSKTGEKQDGTSGEHFVAELHIGNKVVCPHCQFKWTKARNYIRNYGFCPKCGEEVDDWSKCQESS